MKILSYSERGAINSLFYEMKFGSSTLLQDFLKLIFFPFRDSQMIDFNLNLDNDITILIEQSFSDFGDADIVLLLNDIYIGKIIIFIEAKVCAETIWTLKEKYQEFEQSVENILNGKPKLEGHSSNLFTQLYHKFHLIDSIKSNLTSKSINLSPKGVNNSRSFGNNETVLQAIEILKKHGVDNCFYVALIPDNNVNLNPVTKLSYIKWHPDWKDTEDKFGILTWEDIHKYVKDNIKYFSNTEAIFLHNQALGNEKRTKNQIYNPENN